MNPPAQTSEIFKYLSKGQFINADSSDEVVKSWFSVIDTGSHYEELRNYFQHLGFILERGEGYFYFSRRETTADLERKITRAHDWIDYLDFFKTYNNSFGPGFRFSPSEILAETRTNADLEHKLNQLSSQSGKEPHPEILKRVLKKLQDDTYIDLENEITEQYKVLSSFRYLENLIGLIHISPDLENENT